MDIDFFCSYCNKHYASYKSLWNHNKKFHFEKTRNYNHSTIISQPEPDQTKESCTLKCKYCKKMFNHRNNRWRHEKTCKEKEKQELENKIKEKEKEEKKIQEEKKLDLQIKKEENENIRLKLKLKKLEENI